MRVIAGKSGGIPIIAPKNVIARPTTDRVREAIFSSLGDLVIEAHVIDLFAGSGSLGIEALSRGATSVVFVEENRAACQSIRTNLERANLAGPGASVRHGTVRKFLAGAGSKTGFDLVFADPPYARDEEKAENLNALLQDENLAAILNSDGIFALESFAREPVPESAFWKLAREKIYGDTRISFFTRA